jgi:hypothetical protein
MSVGRLAPIGGCIAFIAMTIGCGKAPPPTIVPVSGVVLLNGEPLPQAQVRLIPKTGYGAEYIAVAVTDEQGRFEPKCNGKPGACASENTIVVTEADIPPQYQGENRQRELAIYLRSLKNRPIPQAYASPVTTPLQLTIGENQADLKLELKR